MKSSDFIVEFLVNKGITHAYGYQGTMIAHLVDSICSHPDIINHVCYNEQGAALAAVGEAKTTGHMAFAYSTSGPGAANLINGIADAYYDSAPVLFISGQLNSYEYLDVPGIKQHGFQEMDVVSTVRPVTKYCVRLQSASDLKYELEKAWHYANTGRKGPVLIDIPMNLQREEVDPETLKGFQPEEQDCKAVENDGTVSKYIIDKINHAKRPILVLGNGVACEDKNLTMKVVEKLGIPVITSMLGRDILPYDHMLNFGVIGAAYGHRYANMIAHKKADLIVSIGCSLCKRQTGMKPENFAVGAKIIRVDCDPIELQRIVHSDEVSFLSKAKPILEEIAQSDETVENKSQWVDIANKIKKELKEYDENGSWRTPYLMVEKISDYTRHAHTVTCDVGQHQTWVAQSFNVYKGQKLLFSGGHGVMGFALPAAIGACIGTGKPSVAIAGDGSFQMNIQELQWLYREQLPLTVFVLNNHTLGLIQQQQDDIFEGRYGGSVDEGGYTSPDFAAIAKAYGIDAWDCETVEELEEILKKVDFTKPNLISISMDVKSRAFPKTCFGEEMHNQRPYIPSELMKEIIEL